MEPRNNTQGIFPINGVGNNTQLKDSYNDNMNIYLEENIEYGNSDTSINDSKKAYMMEQINTVSSSGGSSIENHKKSVIILEIEIMKSIYNKWYHHVILLFSAFICGYGYGLDSNIRNIYTGYATASYSEHSLLSTISVINAVAAAISQIIYARASDVFGRLSLLIVSIIFYVVGTIIQSQAYDVQRYCAGAFFYNVGYVGVLLMLLLILSDFSSLKWRLFYQFVPTWPLIINNWISGNIIAKANPTKHWSWDIGMWAFIFPLTCIPILACLLHMKWKASKSEEWQELKLKRESYLKFHGFKNAIIDLFWRLDIIGVLLMGCILGCILVPLTVAGGTSSKWNHGNIIGPFVTGFAIIPILIFWEWKFAHFPLMPNKLVKDRGVWSALAISFLVDFIFYMAADYLYTVLIVAVNESVLSATRITSLSFFVATIFSPFFSLFLTRCTRLKPFIIVGCSLWMLAIGLLYYFRGGEGSHSGIIGALCVWGIGTTLFTYPVTVSVQAAVSHQDMATVTALNFTAFRIGSAVGSAVSGAIWTQTLYKRLLRNMNDITLAKSAYASPYVFVSQYAWGTPIRDAMVEAYRYVQRLETIVALVFCVPLMLFSLCLRDARLTDKVASANIKNGEYINIQDSDPISSWLMKLWRRGATQTINDIDEDTIMDMVPIKDKGNA